jgi:hypothetical protein
MMRRKRKANSENEKKNTKETVVRKVTETTRK